MFPSVTSVPHFRNDVYRFKKILPAKGFALLIQIISSNFAHYLNPIIKNGTI